MKTDEIIKSAGEIEAARVAAETKAASIPKDAAGYKLEIAGADKILEEFGLKPEQVVFDESDPMLAPFREMAVKYGLSQEAFGEALAIATRVKLAEEKAMATAIAGERTKLGANPDARVQGVLTFLTGHVGEDGARALAPMIYTKAQVEALEKLQAVFSSQGARAAPAGGGTEQPSSMPESEFNQLRPAEQLVYARNASKRAA